MENLELDYAKEIEGYEQLIAILAAQKDVKKQLITEYQKKAFTEDVKHDTMSSLEYMDKCHQKAIEVYQLDAEIEQKTFVLAELKNRVMENDAATKMLAEAARTDMPKKIAYAKDLSANMRVPKDLRTILRRMVDRYNSDYKLKGFKDDETAAIFFKGVVQACEQAEYWVKTAKE